MQQGNCVLIEYNKGGNVRKVVGDIYLSGFLAADHTIQQGQAVLTSNEESFKIFTFSGGLEKFSTKSFFSSFN